MEIGELFSPLLKWLLEKRAYVGTAIILAVANWVADSEHLPAAARFFHPGWMENNKRFIPLFVLLMIGSLYLCRTWVGIFLIFLCCAALIAFFIFGYESPAYSEDNWPLVVWVVWRSLLALAVGLVAGLVDRIVPEASAPPPASPAPPGSPASPKP